MSLKDFEQGISGIFRDLTQNSRIPGIWDWDLVSKSGIWDWDLGLILKIFDHGLGFVLKIWDPELRAPSLNL